ncbi:MAG TPA: ABC transporter permease [Bryobacteraceae bacterium]|nr:ABC transporter permease [Bryobacteraceae bacterium]
MNKILLVAKRDYLQMVRSKAYVLGLILLPLLFGGGFLAVVLSSKSNVAHQQRVAVIDRTGVSAAAIIQAGQQANRKAAATAPLAAPVPRLVFEEVKPDADQPAQLLALCDRIRAGDLFLVIDIAPDALQPPKDSKRELVRYYTSSGGLVDPLSLWLPGVVNDGLHRVRLAQLGVDPSRIPNVLGNVALVSMKLVDKDPATGRIMQGEKKNQLQSGAVAFFLVFLLIMIAIFGSAPNLGAVAEDKMQRVFEMLLSSASPFELMMGKVLAAVGASLTSSIVYIIAGLLVLASMAMFGLAPLNLIPWFFVYLIGDVIMLSAVGVALGSACSTPQDAQHLAFILILPIMVPMFMLTPVMQAPNGGLALVMSFIPPFTPVLMLLRQALPGGVPWWQPWLGLLGVIAYALASVWAAARIFRIGILSQGKTPKFAELAQWVLRA